MIRLSLRNRIIVGVIVVATLFSVAGPLLGPKAATDSSNARFNDWVRYYRRLDGYTVEYRNWETFSDDMDVMGYGIQALKMSMDIVELKDLMGVVTVYYDWEMDRIFYIGTGADPTLSYGFYSKF
jgi:hypothetical protein